MGARVKMDEMWDSFLEACHRIEKIADPMTQELVIDMLSAFSPTTYKLTGWEQWMTRMPIPAPVLPITILEENGPQDEDSLAYNLVLVENERRHTNCRQQLSPDLIS